MTSTWTAPESGWYAHDPDAEHGLRKLSDEDAASIEELPDVDGWPLVRFDNDKTGCAAWSAMFGAIRLPNGQAIPARTRTVVTFDTEPPESL